MGGDSARWWQGWLVRGMRRRGWWVITCPRCGGRIELTARDHEQIAQLLHRLGCHLPGRPSTYPLQ